MKPDWRKKERKREKFRKREREREREERERERERKVIFCYGKAIRSGSVQHRLTSFSVQLCMTGNAASIQKV